MRSRAVESNPLDALLYDHKTCPAHAHGTIADLSKSGTKNQADRERKT
jgi:hypothetical protein